MKLVERQITVVLCEHCESEIGIYPSCDDGWYEREYGCLGCSRMTCQECMATYGFSYKGFSVRMCKSCVAQMDALSLLATLEEKAH